MSSVDIILEPALVVDGADFAQQRALEEQRLQQILDEGWEEFEREHGLGGGLVADAAGLPQKKRADDAQQQQHR